MIPIRLRVLKLTIFLLGNMILLFQEEISHGAILGPFDEKPIKDLHISPFLSREKPDSDNRRIIVDLSFPPAFAVNYNIKKDVYLDSPFLLTLPTVDHIVQQIVKHGRG